MTTSAQVPSSAEREQMLAQLDESLARNPDLDASARETILEHFRLALEQEAEAIANGTATAGGAPDRDQWLSTLDSLHAAGMLGQDDREELVQQFDRAMAGLDSEALAVAMEFSRRCRRDGQTAAGEWLKSRPVAAHASGTEGLPAHLAMALQRG
ncbi:hypothetical protein [Novilysobacter defluvii]|uniref:Uncharacterized protein n=1 Tax=Lysobacter defluvii IMMIB APB-9 = DSM 18482 TaxID=1385515 RepID=A0A0A0MA44_9GAMM|nr:hypothetical protein [Lysobacter defluvii]KGO97986.1 hypothetical protein N791_14615 [Lysobacter defluvii IMMIB APB-9 = DSM 18482]